MTTTQTANRSKFTYILFWNRSLIKLTVFFTSANHNNFLVTTSVMIILFADFLVHPRYVQLCGCVTCGSQCSYPAVCLGEFSASMTFIRFLLVSCYTVFFRSAPVSSGFSPPPFPLRTSLSSFTAWAELTGKTARSTAALIKSCNSFGTAMCSAENQMSLLS